MRLEALASLAAASLIASASPAAASVTIGQLAPGSPPLAVCNTGSFDILQPTVTSGNPYVVPGAGTITSWSTNASAGPGQKYRMKMFRQVAGLTYMVVGHDGPRNLTPGALNTFPASIPVKPGDVLGINDNDGSGVMNACSFSAASGDLLNLKQVNLADGESDTFAPFGGDRLNVSAVFVPANTFTLGGAVRNKKKGTATLTVDVPNPGELALSGKSIKTAGAATTVSAPGYVELLVMAKGKKKKKLNQTGKVKVTPSLTFTPTGGDPSTQSTKLKLRKR